MPSSVPSSMLVVHLHYPSVGVSGRVDRRRPSGHATSEWMDDIRVDDIHPSEISLDDHLNIFMANWPQCLLLWGQDDFSRDFVRPSEWMAAL